MAKNKNSIKNCLLIFDVTGAFLNTKVEAINRTMKGNGRVLAVKLDHDIYCRLKENMNYGSLVSGGELFVYANSDRHLVSEDENNFVSEILGANQYETVLMSAGNPGASEELFNFVRSKIEID